MTAFSKLAGRLLEWLGRSWIDDRSWFNQKKILFNFFDFNFFIIYSRLFTTPVPTAVDCLLHFYPLVLSLQKRDGLVRASSTSMLVTDFEDDISRWQPGMKHNRFFRFMFCYVLCQKNFSSVMLCSVMWKSKFFVLCYVMCYDFDSCPWTWHIHGQHMEIRF